MAQRFPICSLPLHVGIINIPYQVVNVLQPSLTHHYHPKFIVHNKIHSWCCTFYGFWQMYNDKVLTIEWVQWNSPLSEYKCIYHYSVAENSSTGLKIHCPLPVHPFSKNSWQPQMYILSIQFCFSIISCSWNHILIVFGLFRLASFT